jgi:two-component system response regulator MprA
VTSAILVVEDDGPIRRMLERTLAAEGYRVSGVGDGGAALAALERHTPDLLVLDLGLPTMGGLTVCRRVRERGGELPILVLTARDAVPDRVAGLDAGADDYLPKPFATDELLARVRALLRRKGEASRGLTSGDLVLDVETRVARRGDVEIQLSEREADLLQLLMSSRRVISREEALATVWGGPGAASPNVVDRYVSYLRRKLGDPPLIRTLHGVGFVIDR